MKPFLAMMIPVLLLLSLSLHAAEDEDTSDQAAQVAEETGSGVQEEAVEALPDIGLIEEEQAEQTEQEDDENFVPSVRISEDLPVAFPVDI